jgi:4-diphosphocytidyl-2-C-methyl-D-erythritol kinase
MVVFPNAKINLGLYITERRSDGYHEINTVMVPIPWYDILECIPDGKKLSFQASGLSIPGPSKENLCLKAYELLRKDYDLPPVHIHLHKVIPFGAGLGGGSADAAFMLRLLSEEFQLFLNDEMLEIYASQLGSDCAFFVKNQPALARGRGEVLSDLDINLKGWKIVVIYPQINVSTAAAYRNCRPNPDAPDLRMILSLPVSEWKNQLHNQFEDTVFLAHPELKELKDSLYTAGASYAAMSGSGSAVFGLFEKELPELDFPTIPDAFICKGEW